MTAVLLLAHGSPDPRSSKAASALAGTVQARSFDLDVRVAFLDHDEPGLAAAVAALAADGVRTAIVVPAFLSSAHHSRVDVPEAVAQAAASTGVDLHLADPLGPDGSLLAAMDRGLPPGPVVLAAAGTSDAKAQRALRRLARVWADRRGAPVALGYAAQADPDVATALGQLEEATGTAAAVGSFVLFPGVLPDRIARQGKGREVTDPLYLAPETVDLVEARIRAAMRKAA
ncbi:MAG: sirohydrochlorin chelatase [Acidimicrobiales bacterium]|nr:sirohydrochlorin chelatase [Acidimicrobiales bacterium]